MFVTICVILCTAYKKIERKAGFAVGLGCISIYIQIQ